MKLAPLGFGDAARRQPRSADCRVDALRRVWYSSTGAREQVCATKFAAAVGNRRAVELHQIGAPVSSSRRSGVIIVRGKPERR